MIEVDNYKGSCEDYIKLTSDDKKLVDVLYKILTKTLKGYKRNIIEEILFVDTIIKMAKSTKEVEQ